MNKKNVFVTAAVMTLAASVVIAPAAWAEGTRVNVGESISVGLSPLDVAFSPDGATAYVTNYESSSVSVITVASGSESQISLTSKPRSIAVSPDGLTAYVTMPLEARVDVIDLVGQQVTGSIPVNGVPYEVEFHDNGYVAYVTNDGDGYNRVSIISVSDGAVNNEVTVGSHPHALALSPDGSQLYVANSGSANVSVINTQSTRVSKTIELDNAALSAIAFTPNGETAYVTHAGGSVSIIDATTGTYNGAGFAAGASPSGVAVSPDGSIAYVTSRNDSTVATVDVASQTITETVGVSLDPTVVEFSPNGTFAYVVGGAANSVTPLTRVLAGTTSGESFVSAAVTPGSITASLSDVQFGAVTFSHDGQIVDSSATLIADDQTGLLTGWGVTVQASALQWTSPGETTNEARNIAPDRLSISVAGNVHTAAGAEFNGTVLPSASALNSAVTVMAAGTEQGSGRYEVPVALQLSIPANAASGTYTGTLTTTISAAP